MFKPWGIHAVATFEDGDTVDTTMWAYHLEDLIDQMQEWMATSATFRLRLVEGSPPIGEEKLADELTRNYRGGKPDERVDWMEVSIEDGAVVAVCNR